MTRKQQLWISGIGLLLAAVAIWVRDRQWLAAPEDSLPLALGLPLAFLLGRPWAPSDAPFPKHAKLLAMAGAAIFAIGWVVGSITVLAVGWTLLSFLWAFHGFAPQPRRGRLALLVLLSFPWLVIEWQAIGWAFRLSSAVVAEGFFRLVEIPATREGTHLNVMGVPIEIEAACAGWNLLQLTLLAGIALGAHEIRPTRRFILLLCLLPGIVWIANLLRILLLSGIALSFDTQTAAGALHGLTGLAVLGTVLAMTKGLSILLAPAPAASSKIVHSS
jgi:exosortase/archaeosortase family protein